ncbi:nonribosomal peptide synthetase MxaA [Ancylobacter pratisalsi]|uniref:Nonribosomal peptide synthetase MxaA n=1 Tax=Ancylobacter pratisalsi TaxID=1745854 RepID=A0A6P1YUK7_9HYPH|nr:nonribosomal peptide synthetase MxaA [Ancylobacter pratisalsi]QIB35763.1 nonribosomal peptide synthetase MxaA [Ancylobacter pratisalsi]
MAARARWVLIGVGLLAAMGAARADDVTLYAPRPFGYVIGDTITLSADVALDPSLKIDPASLPQPRPVDYWLDLKAVRLTDRGTREGARRYRLDLVYQTFYAPLEPKRLVIPALALAAVSDDRRVELAIPPWSFVMSPLREIAGGSGEAMTPRPDIMPRPIATRRALMLSFIGLALAALGAALIGWQRGWWPFHRRRDRPFLRAARSVRAAVGLSPPDYDTALLALHRAFDATAGERVFAEDLDAFLAAHPGFEPARHDIARLFTASRDVFFAAEAGAAQQELPAERLAELAARLRAIERMAA